MKKTEFIVVIKDCGDYTGSYRFSEAAEAKAFLGACEEAGGWGYILED